jgi:hypothetical protein
MVEKFTCQICQKLAITAALAVALCCLPAAAQTSQVNETLILNDKPVTFAEFLKTYPNQAVRSKVLATLDEKSEDAFRDWEMAQLNKRSAEQDAEMAQLNKRSAEQDAEMARLNKRRAEQDVALKLITEVNAILDELAKEQAAPKSATPEQQAINKNRAATIMAALDNAEITNRMKPQVQSILRVISNNLQKGGSIMQMNSDLIKNAKTLP